MRGFLLKSTFFLLIISAFLITIEVLLRNSPNDYKLKSKYLELNASKINSLILGSSHSYYGLNPIYFKKETFNASYISQSLNYDYEIFKKYEPNLNHLKTVIIPISYFTLFSKLEDEKEYWRVKNYVLYYGLNNMANSISDFSEFLSNSNRTNVRKLKAYYLLNQSTISSSNLGWGINYKSENTMDIYESGKSASIRHTYDSLKSKVFDENVEYLYNILKLCETKNIKVVLFTPPAYKTYRENLDKKQLQLTIETTKKIASIFKNCIYVNLLNDSNYIVNDYYDADHLSEIGAKKLSIQIDSIINN